jgi:hypothetical protein
MSPERSREELDDIRSLFCKEHPDAMLRSSTSTYNCMGLVFAARRTHIDVDLVEHFLVDDDWRKLEEKGDLRPGDLVLYLRNGEPAHVGIVWNIAVLGEIMVLSKWGDAGEYFHELNDVPAYCGVASEYYTDRRT